MMKGRLGRRLIACTRRSEFPRLLPRLDLSVGSATANSLPSRVPNSAAEGDEDDVDDKQQDDEDFEDEESTGFELGVRDFVDFAQVLHLLFDVLAPRVELELPHARPVDLSQEPVSP